MSSISGVASSLISDDSRISPRGGSEVNEARWNRGRPKFEAAFARAAEAAGVDPSKVADLQKQVAAAAQEARRSARGSDVRGAVREAIEGVLKSNGVDVAKFNEAMKAEMEKVRSGRRGRGRGRDDENEGEDPAPTPPKVVPTLQPSVDGVTGVDITA